MNTEELKFDAQGLIPCVVQDAAEGQTLMLAYMNRESLAITLAEGRTCFFSRSRGELWRKGETSGHTQQLLCLTADCDGDALLALVAQTGPACHTGEKSCFFQRIWHAEGAEKPTGFSLCQLYRLLQSRNESRPAGSYTTYLFEKGREKILKKIGEECAEVLIAAMKGSRREKVYEIADLTYHLLVLMAAEGIRPEDILSELAGRQVVDQKIKQEALT